MFAVYYCILILEPHIDIEDLMKAKTERDIDNFHIICQPPGFIIDTFHQVIDPATFREIYPGTKCEHSESSELFYINVKSYNDKTDRMTPEDLEYYLKDYLRLDDDSRLYLIGMRDVADENGNSRDVFFILTQSDYNQGDYNNEEDKPYCAADVLVGLSVKWKMFQEEISDTTIELHWVAGSDHFNR